MLQKDYLIFHNLLFFSYYNNLFAQLPIDSLSKLVSNDIKEQTIQCFKNIDTIVKSINHTLDDVVRLTIITKSTNDFNVAIDVLNSFFRIINLH